ncbi:hypothetical protein RF11_10955 [Thelohanellus kitauei]|uniref:Uncharacterized protein n=1 Tax=Thelohanellus kitauei TaxID=669202 RepID=A0A0C2MGB1_THEKT|nr:hypothetical protein RF11_10955 [Thelohanellus kitauei]
MKQKDGKISLNLNHGKRIRAHVYLDKLNAIKNQRDVMNLGKETIYCWKKRSRNMMVRKNNLRTSIMSDMLTPYMRIGQNNDYLFGDLLNQGELFVIERGNSKNEKWKSEMRGLKKSPFVGIPYPFVHVEQKSKITNFFSQRAFALQVFGLHMNKLQLVDASIIELFGHLVSENTWSVVFNLFLQYLSREDKIQTATFFSNPVTIISRCFYMALDESTELMGCEPYIFETTYIDHPIYHNLGTLKLLVQLIRQPLKLNMVFKMYLDMAYFTFT